MANPPRLTEGYLENRLKLRHLRLLLALDTHRAMGRAAAAAAITQPAASRMLAEVEKALCVKLFERLPRGVAPTAYGEVMIRRARSILGELNRAGEEVLALRQGSWVASIGSTSAPGLGLITAAIRGARARRPELGIRVEVEPSEGLIAKVLDGRLDLAICRLPQDAARLPLILRAIAGEKLSVVGGPARGRMPTRLAELTGVEWVLHPPGSVVREAAEAAFRAEGVAFPARIVDTTSFALTLALMREGRALSMAPRSVARLYAALSGVRVLPIALPVSIPPVGLIRARDRPLPPGAMLLLDELDKAIAAMPPEDEA